MRGELSRKVRSTPMPCEATRRTVKLALIPPPRRRMTTPSNTWIRSRFPSITLTLTRTVSPTPNSGTDFFSIVDVTAIIAWVGFIAPCLLRFYTLDFRHEEYYTTGRGGMQCADGQIGGQGSGVRI